ncbi:MAG: S41 family peptidase [Turicibacter sp.]|nr:S41 family peptidase [Turicibacter sp.]
MKKIMFLLAMILVACGGDSEQHNEQYVENIEQYLNNEEQQEDIEQYAQDTQDAYVQRIAERLANQNQLAPEDFLYDLEFLVQVLEENFPFLGLMERRLENSQPLSALTPPRPNFLRSSAFTMLITNAFRDFWHLAHLDLNPDWLNNTNLDLINNTNPGGRVSIDFTISEYMILETIEESKIVLITITPNFFDILSSSQIQEIQSLIREAQGYEHIILDLREVGGGYLDEAITNFISPNIQESIHFQEFAFITDGQIAHRTHTVLRGNPQQSPNNLHLRKVADLPLIPAQEFAEQNNLINMNENDLENLAYGFMLETIIRPTNPIAASSRFREPLFADNIWLLIGPNNYSGAEWFARIAKDAGFTLVGEQASGRIGGAGRAIVSLPRTENVVSMDVFYITDETGRAMEEFPIEPHYFNRLGMDALATTLAIIAERSE